MSNNATTSWILELIDRITKPMRSITRATTAQAEAIEDVQERVKLSEKGTKIALDREKKNRDELKKSIREQEKLIRDLQARQKKSTGAEWQKQEHAIKEAERAVRHYSDALEAAERDIEDLTKDATTFADKNQRWANIATGANQLSENIEKVAGSLDFSQEILRTQTNIQRMTGLTGQELEVLTGRVHGLAAIFQENDMEIARSANAMSKQLGITYNQALDLIQDGFEKGANLNGDMLDQLKEYGPHIKELGISAKEYIAIMALAGKEGIFSDKAIDALKKANQSLKEMDQAQIDALKGIGMSPADLIGKTTFEAIQMISKAMKNADVTPRQKALADIFKGAGEDAGMKFVLEFGESVGTNLENIASVQEAGAGIRGFVADIQTWVTQTLGGTAQYIDTVAMAAIGINSAIGIFNALRSTTIATAVASKIAAAAQWVWNAAMMANPVGLIILAIVALIAIIAFLVYKVDGWGASWNHVVKAAQAIWASFGNFIKMNFLIAVNFVMSEIERLQKAWYSLQSLWDEEGAQSAVSAINSRAEERQRELKDVTEAYRQNSRDFVENAKGAWNSLSWNDKSISDVQDQVKSKLGIDDVTGGGAPKMDGKVSGPSGGGGSSSGGGSDNGMSVSGAGGSKSLTMTLNITNNFTGKVSSEYDIRNIADRVAGIIVDRVRDAAISFG